VPLSAFDVFILIRPNLLSGLCQIHRERNPCYLIFQILILVSIGLFGTIITLNAYLVKRHIDLLTVISRPGFQIRLLTF
jgi:hypothetical protein